MQDRREPDGACAILYTGSKVLLQKRDHRPSRFPNRWAIFGGEIEPDETPEETVCRELRQELGYQLSPNDLEKLGQFRVCVATHWPVVHYYRAALTRDLWDLLLELPKELEGEGDGLALYSHDEIDCLNLRCEDRVALERHFQGHEFGFID